MEALLQGIYTDHLRGTLNPKPETLDNNDVLSPGLGLGYSGFYITGCAEFGGSAFMSPKLSKALNNTISRHTPLFHHTTPILLERKGNQ